LPLVPILNEIAFVNHCVFSSIIVLGGIALAVNVKPVL
jgi:hypothetical protein